MKRSVYIADPSVRNIAAANFFAESNPFATRFIRRFARRFALRFPNDSLAEGTRRRNEQPQEDCAVRVPKIMRDGNIEARFAPDSNRRARFRQ